MVAHASALPPTTGTRLLRIFAWSMVAVTFVFIVNNYFIVWRQWPAASTLLAGEFTAPAAAQAALYAAGVILSILYVLSRPDTPLRADAARLSGIVLFIIRAAFWSVLLIGVVDATLSFLRVQGSLPSLIGPELASKMDFSANRGPMVHYPLVLVGIVLAALTRGMLAFHWLALLVVLSELGIVLSRFIFSYEQAFMGDLVRFWYGALFLFASAYTLAEDGHVRVDVFYSRFPDRAKGRINTIGTVLLGFTFCWVILFFGMGSRSSVINAPMVAYEITQSGFGMYVKYLMAGFLGVFAVSMMVQFSAYMLESAADWRGDPGSKLHARDGELPAVH